MASNVGLPLMWFVAIVALIPLALWLLKRTPMGGAGSNTNVMRTIAVLPLSPSQRLVTVEVGAGDERRWLVLGVTAQSINTLHSMAPQAGPADGPAVTTPFAQLLGHLRKDQRRDSHDSARIDPRHDTRNDGSHDQGGTP